MDSRPLSFRTVLSVFGKLLDLTMLTIPGGKERTEEEYQTLLKVGGFQLTRIIPTKAEVSVIMVAMTGTLDSAAAKQNSPSRGVDVSLAGDERRICPVVASALGFSEESIQSNLCGRQGSSQGNAAPGGVVAANFAAGNGGLRKLLADTSPGWYFAGSASASP
jgi:hypothetical protein